MLKCISIKMKMSNVNENLPFWKQGKNNSNDDIYHLFDNKSFHLLSQEKNNTTITCYITSRYIWKFIAKHFA